MRETKHVTALLCHLLTVMLLPIKSVADTAMINNEKAALRLFLKNTIQSSTSFNDRYDAEVWLITQSAKLRRYIKDPKQRLYLLRAIHKAATEADLNPDIVLSLIQIESAFNQFAISKVGAQGLMQVMPFWKKEIGRQSDNLTDIETNLSYGCRILQFYKKKEVGRGGLAMALARYHGSYPKTYYSEKVMKAWRGRWKNTAASNQHNTASGAL